MSARNDVLALDDEVLVLALDEIRRHARKEFDRSGCTLLIFESPAFACLVGVETGAVAARKAFELETGDKPKRAKRRRA